MDLTVDFLEKNPNELFGQPNIYWTLPPRKAEYTVSPLGFPGGSVVKNFPANVGDEEDAGSVPGLGRSSGGENGNPLQYSCLENHMDRGARRATVHRVANSCMWLSNWACRVSPLHTNLQIVNFQRCDCAFACGIILVHMSGVHCNTCASSTRDCAFVYFTV